MSAGFLDSVAWNADGLAPAIAQDADVDVDHFRDDRTLRFFGQHLS